MSLPSRNNKRKLIYFLPLVLIGSGLIILGMVAAKVITADGSKSDFLVIPAQVNFTAPDLTLNNLEGEKISIADYRKNIILINNWATWCPPCRDEMPTLLKYYEDHRDQGFLLIGIEAGETIEEVTKFVDEYKLTFPILLDPNNQSLIAFHNDSLPSSYVIDRDGTVVLAWTGPISQAMLEEYVTPLLEK